ncbi:MULTISPECIES: hypothetical protein [Bacillaceae]|uniref:hypothetical protein n=1 Tax=Bacillaceae TaxID=186817 RepID=UPI0011455D41|nr:MULTISPECIES: hypothetical protein [Bacillaceae]UGB28846.1 hypothetical protein LPC09_13720 [Metabacillus sp. B2-18]
MESKRTRGGVTLCSQYDCLSSEMIIEFYFEFKQKIENKELSEVMNTELELIKEAAKNKGIIFINFI